MMVIAVRKEEALRVGFKVRPFLAGALALVGIQDRFQRLADGQTIAILLVIENIAAAESGFIEVIRQFLLLQAEGFPSTHLVTQYLDVGKAIRDVVECGRIGRCGLGRRIVVPGTVSNEQAAAGQQRGQENALFHHEVYGVMFGLLG